MSTTSQPSSVVEVQFVQQNVYIGVGIFSLVTSALCTFVIGYSKSIRLAQPFFLAISIGDLITSSAYVVSGVTRYVQLDNNYYFTLVKPSECLKQPLLHLYYLGVQFACLIGCLMAVERLVSVSVPDWFKTNWTPPVTRWLIVLIAGYTTVSVGLGYVAILSFNATGATLQAKCSLTVVGGPVYTAYFYSLCVGSTSLAQVLAIAAFVIGLFRLRKLKLKNKSYSIVQKQLSLQMGQIVTVLLLNMVSFALSITTNVNALNTAVGGPTFDPNSFGGKVALGAYCLSCGLTVFILMAFNRDVRLEILRTFRCGKRSSNSVIPIDAIAVAF